jgi:predicted ester cyclase
MALFRKKQKDDHDEEPSGDMMDQLARMSIEELEDSTEVRYQQREVQERFDKQAAMIARHLEVVHMPGGLARIKQEADFMDLGAARPYLDSLSDITFEIGDQVPAGNQIFTTWTVTGTHTGELCGIAPTGERVTMRGVTMSVIRDGVIATEYTYWDFAPVTAQLLSPAPS